MSDLACTTTRYGPGCGHPVSEHDQDQTRACCCCTGRHNDPSHVATCFPCSEMHRKRRVRMGWETEQ